MQSFEVQINYIGLNIVLDKEDVERCLYLRPKCIFRNVKISVYILYTLYTAQLRDIICSPLLLGRKWQIFFVNDN